MNSPSSFKDILTDHLERFPFAEPGDLYKLVHQASLGVGHYIESRHEALSKLHEEIDGLDLSPLEHEEVIEAIHHERPLVRVHLRPYLRSGGDLGRLARAMILTRDSLTEVDPERLGVELGQTRLLLREMEVKFDLKDFDILLREVAVEGFPARSHTETFRELYDPHYRVVLLDTLSDR